MWTFQHLDSTRAAHIGLHHAGPEGRCHGCTWWRCQIGMLCYSSTGVYYLTCFKASKPRATKLFSKFWIVWNSDLVCLLANTPWSLPARSQGQIFHPASYSIDLMAWLLNPSLTLSCREFHLLLHKNKVVLRPGTFFLHKVVSAFHLNRIFCSLPCVHNWCIPTHAGLVKLKQAMNFGGQKKLSLHHDLNF